MSAQAEKQVRNGQLRDSLWSLYQSVVSILQKELKGRVVPLEGFSHASPYATTLYANNQVIKGCPAWSEGEQRLKRDAVVSKHLDTIVGTDMGQSRLDADGLLTGFLNEMMDRGGEAGADVRRSFDQFYPEVERFFYADTISMAGIIPLIGLNSALDHVHLDRDFSIERVSQRQSDKILERRGMMRPPRGGLEALLSEYQMALVIRFELPKRI